MRDLAARKRGFAGALVCAAFLALGALPVRLVDPHEKAWGISDERTFYPLDKFAPLTLLGSQYPDWGRTLRDRFAGAAPPVTIALGPIGVVGYLSQIPVVDIMGLTDPATAHRSIAERGRPGHERRASNAHLLDRGVDLVERRIYPPEYDSYSKVDVGNGLEMYRTTARDLPGESSEMATTGRDIDAYQTAGKDAPTMACDLWFLREFYFARAHDDARWTALVEKLSKAGALAPEAADFLERPTGMRPVATLEWKREEVEIVGDTFADSPMTTPPLSQDDTRGSIGPFLDSYTAAKKDAARGSLRSRPFEIVGDVMELRVGGGKDPTLLSVRLVVGGKVVAEATGCESELMGERVWGTSRWRGQTARIEVIDHSAAGWGHLLVGGFTQWAR